MKKHLFFVALAGIALAGCVKNEVETPETKRVKIGFASPVLYSNVDTKASVYGEIGSHKYDGTETIYTYPREEKFQIFAVEHSGNLASWDAATPTEFNATAIAYNNFCYIVSEEGFCVTLYPLPVWFGKKKHFNGKERIRNMKAYARNYAMA